MTLNIGADGWKIEPSFTPDGIGNWSGNQYGESSKKQKYKIHYMHLYYILVCDQRTQHLINQNLISLVSNIIFTIAKKWKPKMSFNQ